MMAFSTKDEVAVVNRIRLKSPTHFTSVQNAQRHIVENTSYRDIQKYIQDRKIMSVDIVPELSTEKTV